MGSTRKYLATALLGFATVAGVLLPAAAAQAAPVLPKNVNIHVDVKTPKVNVDLKTPKVQLGVHVIKLWPSGEIIIKLPSLPIK